MASILVVCTGNICRSPMAEGFIRRALDLRIGDAAPRVHSAGTIARDGSPARDETIEAAAEHGLDLSGFRTTGLAARQIEEEDLVVCMAGEHRDEVVDLVPAAEGRTFTLKQLVRLLEELGPGAGDLGTRVSAADGLRRRGFDGNPHDDDVADPLGLSIDAFRAVAWELEGWCERLGDALVDTRAAVSEQGG